MHRPASHIPAQLGGAGAYRSRDERLKLLALVAVGSAALTAMVCDGVIYKRDVQQAQAWRAREASDIVCVKHYKNGWSYDDCEAKALRAADAAQRELARCLANFDRQPDNAKDFEAACKPNEHPWTHPYE